MSKNKNLKPWITSIDHYPLKTFAVKAFKSKSTLAKVHEFNEEFKQPTILK